MKISVDLRGGARGYEVEIGALPSLEFNRKVAVVTNTTIFALYEPLLRAKILARDLVFITIDDGEEFKTLATAEHILNELFRHKFNRTGLLIAFGGGVVSDITGFCASIYQRGIDFLIISTTLLGMVDASVGGKTGVNNAFGKNLIGAFYQPRAVYLDPAFLQTLPRREFNAGVAELVKMAVMFSAEFFAELEILARDLGVDLSADPSQDLSADLGADISAKASQDLGLDLGVDPSYSSRLQAAIARSVSLKASVVSLDEREQGARRVLNYGHTFAHVIENQTAYKKYLHGEAVAIGMVMANALAVRLGLLLPQDAARIEALLKKFALPTFYAISSAQEFYDAFFLDKKSQDNKVIFILPKGIGAHEIRGADREIVLEVLNEFVR
ncbi:MAG: 3-dehydroquinate synthase [Helicobacteraceae bacterium]